MTAHTPQRSAAEAALTKQFEAERGRASPRRAAAFARFSERGLPTRRVESWHYTDLRAAMTDVAPIAFAPSEKSVDAARRLLAGRERLGPVRIVLLEGRFVGELSDRPLANVAVVDDERSSARIDDAMVALNEAMSVTAYEVRVSDRADIAGPIEIVHLTVGDDARSVYSRVAISLGVDARASFIETFLGGGPATQRNALTTISLAAGASAKHIAVVGDDAALHIESQIGELAANAELNAFALVAGGALTRRQIFLNLIGEGTRVALGGLALIDGSRRADTTLQVSHLAPAGKSREFYRAIVDDDAIGVFQGKIIVANAAQQTDGSMKSQAILLSPRAQMNTKPELEIFADDVVCGHGATVGSLDPEQLFYLESRGIAKGEAEAMLLEAFGGEAIDRIEDPTLAKALRERFRAWLESAGARSVPPTYDMALEALE
jgi:Fe-S cluster assembly protein SufD